MITQRHGDPEKGLNEVSGVIGDAALAIHRDLGPGLLETVYGVVLANESRDRGFVVERQVSVPIRYNQSVFEEGFRADLILNNVVCVELKEVEVLNPVHSKQPLTYLKLLRLEVGLLINFGASTLKEGLHRVVNNYVGPKPNLLSSPRLSATA